jgi:hypothetical protein
MLIYVQNEVTIHWSVNFHPRHENHIYELYPYIINREGGFCLSK